MIDFNVPPYVGTELKYVAEAVEKNHKICGDGPFTKRCNAWLEEKTGTSKALLTTSCTHATEMAALLADIKEGDEVIMPSYTLRIYGRCICTSWSSSGICRYPSRYYEY